MANRKDFGTDRERRKEAEKTGTGRTEQSAEKTGRSTERSDQEKYGAPKSERFEESTYEWSEKEDQE